VPIRMEPPRCMATMIGSLPHTDPDKAVRLVLDNLDEAPIWPELNQRSFWEDMVHSHTEDLPCLVEDESGLRMYLDTERDCSVELAGFYEKAMSAEQGGDLSGFAMSPKYASALDLAAREMEGRGRVYPVVKVHCIGPVSFQLQLSGSDGKALYYHDTYQDVLSRQIQLQARWITRRFAPYGRNVISFLDEPSLAAFGSSGYIGVTREQVVARLGAAVAALKTEGAIVGVHVCGNTDWSMIIESGADLLNYDAYGYGSSILIYAREVADLMSRGGVLAWGIVPNNEALRGETVPSIEKRFFSLVEELASKGVDRESILRQSMLTPACGLGSLSVEDAERAVQLLTGLAKSVQSKVRH
jgi:hypothetical protein